MCIGTKQAQQLSIAVHWCALQVSFADTLGAAKHSGEDEVNSKNEAKKLAFYLFWNIKPSFNRYGSP